MMVIHLPLGQLNFSVRPWILVVFIKNLRFIFAWFFSFFFKKKFKKFHTISNIIRKKKKWITIKYFSCFVFTFFFFFNEIVSQFLLLSFLPVSYKQKRTGSLKKYIFKTPRSHFELSKNTPETIVIK